MIPRPFLRKAGTSLIWLLVGYGARQVADPWLDEIRERIPFLAEHSSLPPVPYDATQFRTTHENLSPVPPWQGLVLPQREIPALLEEARYVP